VIGKTFALVGLSILLVAIVVAAVRTDPWYLTAVVAAVLLFVWKALRGEA